MNVGIVTTWFPAGAGYVSKQYEAALATEHTVFIYARGGRCEKGNPEWDRPNVTWASAHYHGTGVWKRHFVKWLRDNKIQSVIFNEQRFYSAIRWAKDAGVSCGAYIDYYTQETVPVFALYDYLICNTKRHYSVFKWHPHCFYVPWGVMPELLDWPANLGAKRLLTFMASAGWTPSWTSDRRGALTAIRAFRNVKGDCLFKLYSQVAFEKMQKPWQDAIRADRRIELTTGSFSPFPYDDGDVYVYPSRLDGIGLTLPEALGHGLPSIATDCAPMNEFVRDGENGKLVDVEYYTCRGDAYYWPESRCSEHSVTSAMQHFVDHAAQLDEFKAKTKSCARRDLNWMGNSKTLCKIVGEAFRTDGKVDDRLFHREAWYYPCVAELRCLINLAKVMLGIKR